MLNLLVNNYLLILNLLLPFLIGLYFYLTHKEYSLKEFIIQVCLTFSVIILAFVIGYNVSDIYTKNYYTTNVDKFTYEESWTEKVTYSESYKCGKSTCYRTKTRYDYHPDSYFYTVPGNIVPKYITKKEYEIAKIEFGEKLTKRTHIDQSSWGDGRIYDVIPNKFIVHADYTSEINYIYASKKNIIKSNEFKELEKLYKTELKEYPKFFTDKYGNINYNRIINDNLISLEIKEKIKYELEQLSINLNVNPIIYLTTSKSRDFAYAVKGFYQDKYYNDAMLVISVENDKINWIEPISLSKSVEFKVFSTDLTNNFEDLVPKFKEVISKHWVKPNLEEYNYLAGDIDIPVWYEIVIVLLNVVGSFFIFRYMFKHEL